jgi:cation:H+ antiporter
MLQPALQTGFWIIVFGVGLAGASFASRRAVVSALRVSETLKISPAVVGLTVMSIGTDLPEIANSLVSSASGHGDVNVGDSIGSTLTQVTLTLGLLCLANQQITTNRNFVLAVGTTTIFSVIMVRVLVDDGDLDRFDGLLLILLWVVGTAVLAQGQLKPREVFTSGHGPARTDAGRAVGWLAAVGLFAVLVVESFLEMAALFGVPEFIGSFLVLSIGTSLPELFVDWKAIREGASSMAVGDIFGSSFVDATLSIGIGPAVFSTLVSSDVLFGIAVAAVGVAAATILVVRTGRYDRRLGLALIAVYAVAQIAVAVIR